jgi:hypothetical protein
MRTVLVLVVLVACGGKDADPKPKQPTVAEQRAACEGIDRFKRLVAASPSGQLRCAYVCAGDSCPEGLRCMQAVPALCTDAAKAEAIGELCTQCGDDCCPKKVAAWQASCDETGSVWPACF